MKMHLRSSVVVHAKDTCGSGSVNRIVRIHIGHHKSKQQVAEHGNGFSQVVNLAHASRLAAQVRKAPGDREMIRNRKGSKGGIEV